MIDMLIKIKKAGALLLFILTLCLATINVQARPSLNIGLTRFQAFPMDNAVRLEWDTETELGTAGYKLKRGQNGSFTVLQNNDGSAVFINSEGGPSQGSSYQFVDNTALNGEDYTYQLIEVTIDGGEALQADLSVTAGIEPTNTPIILGDGGDNPQGSTNTPAPTNTPTPTTSSNNTPTVTVSSPTRSTQTPTVPSASPTQVPQANTTAIVNPTAAQPTQSSLDEQPFVSSTTEQPIAGPGIEVAQALEETPIPNNNDNQTSITENPEQELQELENADSTSIGEDPTDNNNSVNAGSSQPSVIGQVQIVETQTNTEVSNQAQDSNPNQEPLQGRIYLWVAFVAALVIFISAVLGAILLYTRRQKRE